MAASVTRTASPVGQDSEREASVGPVVWRQPIRALKVATGAVALSLCGLTIFFGLALREIRPEAERIETMGAVGTEGLAATETALRRLDRSLDAALLALRQGRPPPQDRIASARAELGRRISTEQRAPVYRGELALQANESSHLRAVDSALDRLLLAIDLGDSSETSRIEATEWRPASDALDDDLRALSSFHVRRIVAHAARIRTLWRIATLGALCLGALEVLLLLASMRMVAKLVNRQAVADEARAVELELFSQRMAHDVQSPLAAALLALDVARRGTDERIRRMAERGVSALERSQGVVQALLRFARSGARPEVGAHAAVAALVAELADELRPQAELQQIELSAGPVPEGEVACPAGVLTVLLENLVRNALKFMGDRKVRQVTLRVEAREKSFLFEVEDTGPGLPAGVGLEIFEPYVRGPTTETAGVGLGLATVRRLALAHNGSVGFRSKEGVGSTFWIELPRWASEPVAA